MARIEALANPALMVWARESAGLTREAIAKKIGVAVEQIERWETGLGRPSVPQLRSYAAATKRPLAVFYLPEPPKTYDMMHDFRAGSTGELVPLWSPELAQEVRKAYDRREWAIELMKDLDQTPPPFGVTATLNDDPESTAEKLRDVLQVTLKAQQSWRVDNEAFREWRSLVERAGVLVFQATDIQLPQARGFSVALEPLPAVVVNIKDAYRGRIFTLLHELTHIALNNGGICDLDDNKRRNLSARIEAHCNRTAGAVLFPKGDLLQTEIVRGHPRSRVTWTDDEVLKLSRRFGGSREALLVRLLTLGLTDERFYWKKRDEYLREYAKWREQKKGGFAPPHVVALSSAGPLFTGLVIENFNREHITASDVSDFLQIRLKHLPEIQRDYSRISA